MRWPVVLFLGVTLTVQGQRSDFGSTDFTKADSIAIHFKEENLKNLPALVHKLTATLPTDVEKFRAIYTWVSTAIENDYEAYRRTVQKRRKFADDREAYLAWNNTVTPAVFKNLLNHKKTACTGYAYLICEMAALAGFDCQMINGYGRTPSLDLNQSSTANHSWNKVKLNEKWYLCDATWSAGRILIEENGPRFEHDYHDGYFLSEPKLFIKNHYPLNIEDALLEVPPTFEGFIAGPVVYKDAFTLPIIPHSPEKMQLQVSKNETVDFVLEIPEGLPPEKLRLVLTNGTNEKQVRPETLMGQKKCTLRHTFANKGLFDVHIMFNDTYLATYVVRVKP